MLFFFSDIHCNLSLVTLWLLLSCFSQPVSKAKHLISHCLLVLQINEFSSLLSVVKII